MRRVRRLVALAASALLLLPGQASAVTTVSISGVTLNGNVGTVTGTASFDAITDAVSVGGTNTNWGPAQAAPIAEAAGINMTDAKIAPLPNNAGLRFIWELSALPAQVPPEVVRYTWSFKIGTNQYQLQAKRTNMVSTTTTEDPVNHVKQLAAQKDFFQLRGACVTDYVGLGGPVTTAGCYHLAWLNGSFDVAGKKVTMDMPFQTKDQIGRVVAPDFKPGAIIEANETAGMSIAAAFQAVVGNTTTSDFTNGWSSYYIAPQVSLAVGNAGVEPSTLTYGAPVTLSGSGFTGTVTGVTAAKNTVYARACNGLDCSYTSFKAL